MTAPEETELPFDPDELRLAFAPLSKWAFGVAVGLAFGLVIAAATILVLLREQGANYLRLLSNYFYGYSISWRGALIGFCWAFVGGFAAGWFVAFCRNFALAVSIFLVTTRADLIKTKDFLDHI